MVIKKIVAIIISVLQLLNSIIAQENLPEDPKQLLEVGAKAPSLNIIKWINGEPVKSFKKGRFYLVEFGFINCMPCQASIPELINIQSKYADDLSVISVHIWENNKENPADLSYIERVERYIKEKGEKINFEVAVDEPEQSTAEAWVKATGETDVPKTFIIDSSGTIIWIGTPREIEKVLIKIFDNNFDSRAALLKQEIEKKDLENCLNAPSRERVINCLNSLIKKSNDNAELYYWKFVTLKDSNESAANQLVQWMLNTNRNDFDLMMFHIAQYLLYFKKPDYDLVIEATNRALKVCKSDAVSAFILDIKARAFFEKKCKKKAESLEQQAIDFHKNAYGAVLTDKFLIQERANFTSHLEMFRRPGK
jgi:thiol-disulfide isomerase/thioredoxin